jgi:hypothetical protein
VRPPDAFRGAPERISPCLEAAERDYERRRLERNEAIRAAAAGGMTYRAIPQVTGLSVQRVGQIAKPD